MVIPIVDEGRQEGRHTWNTSDCAQDWSLGNMLPKQDASSMRRDWNDMKFLFETRDTTVSNNIRRVEPNKFLRLQFFECRNDCVETEKKKFFHDDLYIDDLLTLPSSPSFPKWPMPQSSLKDDKRRRSKFLFIIPILTRGGTEPSCK